MTGRLKGAAAVLTIAAVATGLGALWWWALFGMSAPIGQAWIWTVFALGTVGAIASVVACER